MQSIIVMSQNALPIIGTLVVVLKFLMSSLAVETYNTDVALKDYSCPPWYILNGDGKCSFSHKLPQIVRQYGNTSELEMGFCMTVTNSSLVVAQCPYLPVNTHNLSQYHSIYQVLPTQLDQINNSLCAPFNRKGFLCSECEENYGLAAYRYYGLMCVKCSNLAVNWISFILLLFTPPTLFFLAFLFLNINLHSGRLTGFIFFSHAITTTTFFFPTLFLLPQSLFGYWPFQILMALYGIWSLNFLQFLIPPFCVSTSLSTLQLVSLGYVSSIYPLVLCIITYYLIEFHARGNWLLVKAWRPFYRLFIRCIKPNIRSLNLNSSVIHTFGTFILLSYGKNVFVTLTLLQSTKIVELDLGTNTLHSLPPYSVDLGVPYFGATHAPYAALGLFGGVITIILPLVLVLIYPTQVFPKLIGCCGLRRWHMICTFMEVFVGSYKDGTEGGRDYRLTAALYLFGHIILGVDWSISKCGANTQLVQWYGWLVSAVPFILFAMAFALFQPHRKWCHNAVDVLLLLLIAKLCICFYIVYQTTISEQTLHIVVLLILIDLAVPHVILIVYCGIKVLLWACSRGVKLGNSLSRNHEDNEDTSNFQQITSESQPLLCP